MTALQIPLDLQFRPAFGREDFFVTGSNASAVGLIDAWPQSWGGFPALTIFGPAGSGKSHLAAVWAQQAKARSLTAANFTASSIESLIAERKNLVLERLDLLVGDSGQEHKIFHLYNACKAADLYLLLTSHLAPSRLEFSLPDLASRLRASSAVEIHQPDDDLFCAVLIKQLHDRGFIVADKVALYAVERMERSWPAMSGLVDWLTRNATAEKKGITLPMIRRGLLSLGAAD